MYTQTHTRNQFIHICAGLSARFSAVRCAFAVVVVARPLLLLLFCCHTYTDTYIYIFTHTYACRSANHTHTQIQTSIQIYKPKIVYAIIRDMKTTKAKKENDDDDTDVGDHTSQQQLSFRLF